MIVEFSVKNFRSIKDLQTISFATTGLKSATKYKYIDQNNISNDHGQDCFNVIGLYGANSSGKSNVIKAFNYFVEFLSKQAGVNSDLTELYQPFLFQTQLESSETFFQIIFILNKKKYRYGFTVKKNQLKSNFNKSDEIIGSEWLYADVDKNMTPLFIREDEKPIKNNLSNKKSIPTKNLYSYNLFLIHAAAFDMYGDCKNIIDYFSNYATSDYEFNHQKFRWLSIYAIETPDNKMKFLNLLSAFNINVQDIEIDDHDDKGNFPQDKINFIRNGVRFNLKKHESSGTQKMFDLAGLLIRVFNNTIPCFITLDEIDSHFHPALLIKLVEMFNNPKINKTNSQLLFTSHDTNLLSPNLMRRDQFYFAEKADNSTKIYSLANLKGIRNTANFAKEYLAGHYGALPILEEYCDTSNLEVYE